MANESKVQAALDYEYLPVRAKILEIAASLDRLQRAANNISAEARHQQLRAGIELLLEADEGRAERVQLLFSRPYDAQWRDSFEPTR